MTDSELNEAIVIAMVKAPDERTRNRIAALAKDPELTKRALAGNAKSGTKAIVSPGRKAIETPMPAASAAGAPRPRPEMTGVDGSQMVPTAPHAVREMGKLLASSKDPGPGPGGGHVYVRGNEAWYVGSPHDPAGWAEQVRSRLGQIGGVDNIRYEVGQHPPEDDGWTRAYPGDDKALLRTDEHGRYWFAKGHREHGPFASAREAAEEKRALEEFA